MSDISISLFMLDVLHYVESDSLWPAMYSVNGTGSPDCAHQETHTDTCTPYRKHKQCSRDLMIACCYPSLSAGFVSAHETGL